MNAYGFQRIWVGMRYQEAITHARGQMIGGLTRLSRIERDEAGAPVAG